MAAIGSAQTRGPVGSSSPYVMRNRLWHIGLYLVAIVLCLIFGFPFFYTITSSLKAPGEIFLFPPTVFPEVPQWSNYAQVLDRFPFVQWFFNTVLVTILATLGTVLSASLVAYSFARFQYRGRDTLFVITLATMMMPAQITLIPQFILFWRFGWIDTLYPLWVPLWFGGSAFFIFLIRQFIMSLPRDLDEAALIDGASRFRILWNILLPLSKPVLATAAIIAYMAEWNRFMEPLIFLNTPTKFTLSVGISFLRQHVDTTEILQHLLMAAAVMMIAPTLIVFFAAQKYFVQGVVMSGLKG
ncbi:MAG: carbohydrate ABC transporter permease [Litorilinea sp.]